MAEEKRYATQEQLDRIETKVNELSALKDEVMGAVKFAKIIVAVVAAAAAAWTWIVAQLSHLK